MFKFYGQGSGRARPESLDLSHGFELMSTSALKAASLQTLQTLQTSQIMCRSIFLLFLICRKTSLLTMKAVAAATD